MVEYHKTGIDGHRTSRSSLGYRDRVRVTPNPVVLLEKREVKSLMQKMRTAHPGYSGADDSKGWHFKIESDQSSFHPCGWKAGLGPGRLCSGLESGEDGCTEAMASTVAVGTTF